MHIHYFVTRKLDGEAYAKPVFSFEGSIVPRTGELLHVSAASQPCIVRALKWYPEGGKVEVYAALADVDVNTFFPEE